MTQQAAALLTATDYRTARPPDSALAWAPRAAGAGTRLVRVQALRGGVSHANHLLTVESPLGHRRRFVLRRWARPGWTVSDAAYDARRELAALRLLEGSDVPAPRVVAADPDARACDVPALLLSLVPGRRPGPEVPDARLVAGLAETLVRIHAVDGPLLAGIPAYTPFYEADRLERPGWWQDRRVWDEASSLFADVDAARGAGRGGMADAGEGASTPAAGVFLHRDYHPGNTLWQGRRVTGVVDWTTASRGEPGVDTGHMRVNLVLLRSAGVADAFLRAYEAESGTAIDPLWDAVSVLDIVGDVETALPGEPYERLEALTATALAARR